VHSFQVHAVDDVDGKNNKDSIYGAAIIAQLLRQLIRLTWWM